MTSEAMKNMKPAFMIFCTSSTVPIKVVSSLLLAWTSSHHQPIMPIAKTVRPRMMTALP
ncbi:hypothetical protein D3C87_2137570 [compost metagenome]